MEGGKAVDGTCWPTWEAEGSTEALVSTEAYKLGHVLSQMYEA